ncbi:MAG: mucoidy inhibitor MuiA family protein [Deltaproteobacteria bacterium]|nr:mucoidy inhibitor MuiA family protein [Deltaproteobacteria bacterium]
MTTVTQEPLAERHDPPVPADAQRAVAPVVSVTLLEDRAQVSRRGRVNLHKGQNRLVVADVAPVLQDVSVRGSITGPTARVVDVGVRRAMRIRTVDKPAAARELEERIRALAEQHRQLTEDHDRAQQELSRVAEIIQRGLGEIPEDAGWGLGGAAQWKDTFRTLFDRARALRAEVQEAGFRAEELAREVDALAGQRRALDRVDSRLVAWLEADVLADADGEVELQLDYVVPCALWRPLHTARLSDDGRLRFSSSAAVWQNTGEDWKDAALSFSTARSSLGTEPPLLADDLLAARKKADQVVVAAREVAVQRAGLGSGPSGGTAPPSGVELPGVDDGGEIRNLRALAPCTVPSDGRPCVIPLFSFDDAAEVARVCYPELDPKVFLKVTARNTGAHPVLAGPVELMMHNGFVGYTRTLFVAAQEKFELGFGPDDAVRVVRRDSEETEQDPVSKWNVHTRSVVLYLSNLSGDARKVDVVERLPVSELEHVKVTLVADKTTGAPKLDDNGFCRWQTDLAGNAHLRLLMRYRLSTAPGVQGL